MKTERKLEVLITSPWPPQSTSRALAHYRSHAPGIEQARQMYADKHENRGSAFQSLVHDGFYDFMEDVQKYLKDFKG